MPDIVSEIYSDTSPLEKQRLSSARQLSERDLREFHEGSGLSREIIQERASYTALTVDQLPPGVARLAPALVIPNYDGEGRNGRYTTKPHHPRKNAVGDPIKYESQIGQPPPVDMHPRSQKRLADHRVPQFWTEGVKKGDKATQDGYCAVALNGVWGWVQKGRVPLEALKPILAHVRDRLCILCFDSDPKPTTVANVTRALDALAEFLEAHGAIVLKVTLPALPGQKVAYDDYRLEHSLADFQDLVQHEMVAALAKARANVTPVEQRVDDLLAENRALKERLAATAALLEVPTKKLDPGDKAVLLATAAELDKRSADAGATDERPFVLETMGRRAGVSAGTFGRKLDRFCKGPNRLFEKRRAPANPSDPNDPRRVIYLRPVRERCATFEGVLWSAITSAETKPDIWGGKREPKQIPPCTIHGEAEVVKVGQHVCAAPDVDGSACGEPLGEPTQRVVNRNTQDAFSPPGQVESVAIDVAPAGPCEGKVQDAFSGTGVSSEDSFSPPSVTKGTQDACSAPQLEPAAWDTAKADALAGRAREYIDANCPDIEPDDAIEQRIHDACQAQDLEALRLALHDYMEYALGVVRARRSRAPREAVS